MKKFGIVNMFWTALGLCLLLSACREVKFPPLTKKFKYRYFPTEIGHTTFYVVDSVQYDDFDMSIDSVRWYVREVIDDTFTDNQGRASQRINVFVRQNSSDPWEIEDVIFSTLNTEIAERVVDNLRYGVMAFPAFEGKEWNGTAALGNLADYTGVFNPACVVDLAHLKDWDYEMRGIHDGKTVAGLPYDSTITVIQEGDSNLFEINKGVEVYATGVGLVSQEFTHITTTDVNVTDPWHMRAECGYTVYKRLYDWNE